LDALPLLVSRAMVFTCRWPMHSCGGSSSSSEGGSE
jgi:hypothetical protein